MTVNIFGNGVNVVIVFVVGNIVNDKAILNPAPDNFYQKFADFALDELVAAVGLGVDFLNAVLKARQGIVRGKGACRKQNRHGVGFCVAENIAQL